MFEKEAEEYGKLISKGLTIEKGSYTEFALKSGILGFKQGAEFGYNKANEWHYCKNGLPEKEKYVLIYTEIKNVYMARLVKDDYFITKEGGFVQSNAVIAWKEIVLSELPKESE